jgi:hypothetical protein
LASFILLLIKRIIAGARRGFRILAEHDTPLHREKEARDTHPAVWTDATAGRPAPRFIYSSTNRVSSFVASPLFLWIEDTIAASIGMMQTCAAGGTHTGSGNSNRAPRKVRGHQPSNPEQDGEPNSAGLQSSTICGPRTQPGRHMPDATALNPRREIRLYLIGRRARCEHQEGHHRR